MFQEKAMKADSGITQGFDAEDEPSEDEMMEVPMTISKGPKKIYTEQDMLLAAKYGYNFHKTTSFPDQEFEDSCVRNTQQWLTTLK